MKIDLHVHTRERSPCAHSPMERMIRAAIDSGLDGMVISDHDRLVPSERLSDLNAKYAPFRIFGGIEVTLAGEHALVLGVRDARLETRWWTYPDLHAFVEGREGFLALAHPFRFGKGIEVDIARFPPHALEIHSHNTPRRAEPYIQALAAALNLPLLSNSDAHYVGEIGVYYNALREAPDDVQGLVTLLKAGAFTPVAPRD
ncbi:MAG: PHP-associated domain-containing protein [Anaerolineae bacterium]|jgi:histidinol phosphatase-like PHP family hydrolase